MAIDPIKITIEGENKVLANFKAIEAESKKVFSRIKANISKELSGAGAGLGKSVTDGLKKTEKTVVTSAKKLSSEYTKVFQKILKGARGVKGAFPKPPDPGSFNGVTAGVGSLIKGLGTAGLAIEGIKSGFEIASAAGQAFYQPLIASNEQLNQQILGSAANLAATSRILKDGSLVTGPTEAIKLLQGPLRTALKQIQKDSIDLVGITSEKLTGVFSILNSQAGQLVGQSKELADPIKAAGKLTIDFSAALGTIGLPLEQAGQEIRSILQGTIDANSSLAKQLGITNEQVKLWREQGKLVDQLRERLQPFVEGNALAAKSIGGVTSNIKDVVEVLGRELGEPLLAPLVEGLEEFYKLIQITEDETQSYYDEIKDFFEPFIAGARQAGELIGQDLLKVVMNLGEAAQNWQPIFLAAFKGISLVAKGVSTVLVGITELMVQITQRTSQLIDAISSIPTPVNPFRALRKDAEEAIGVVGQQYEALADQVRTVQAEIEALEAKRAGGAKLSSEEVDREKALRVQAEGLLVTLREIKQNSSTNISPFGSQAIGDLKNLNNEIDQTEALLEALTGGDISVLARDIPEVGSAFRQLAKDANGALTQVRALSENGGDAAQLQAVAKGLVDATKQQVQLGAISREQAQQRLQELVENTRIERTVKVQAVQEIQALQEKASQEAVAAKKLEISETQALIDSGKKGEIEGLQAITKLKQDEINIQLNALREQLRTERQLKQQAIQEDLAALDQQIAEARDGGDDVNAAGLQAQRDGLAATLQLQSEKETQLIQKEQELQQNLKQVTEQGARDIAEAQIREIEKSVQKTLEATDAAATQRELAAQELFNQELAALSQQTLTAEEQAEKLTELERNRSDEQLTIQRDRIQAELAAEQQRIAQLEALSADSPAQAKKNESAIRDAKRKTAQLTLELARNEESQQRALTQRIQEEEDRRLRAAQRAIEERLQTQLNAITAQSQALEGQLSAYDAITRQLTLQVDLLNAQADSAREFNATTQDYFGIAARFTDSEEKRRKIEEEAARAKLAAQEKEFMLAQQQLELEQAQNKALLQQEALQARIATLKAQANAAQAQANLASVEADPQANPQQILAAQLQLEAAQKSVSTSQLTEQFIQERIKQQSQLDQLEREQLLDRQGRDRLSAEADLAELTESTKDDQDIQRRALQQARRRTQETAQPSSSQFNQLIQQFNDLFQGAQLPTVQSANAGRVTTATVSDEATRAALTTMPSADEIGVAVAGALSDTGERSVILQPTINNTFQQRPSQKDVRDVEQATLRTMKNVLDLAAQQE
ncbi:hypothetical protein D0962_22830 [Leptolyngbyaceae cyanobacterium CCMR0082]|uniref:Tape measure domain-containing protein n=1 Tax=Adonisia turfae CCMR0082 TaxID=2304604 RepID=A0A6M0SB76_9CYAN|nr:hypothetical protein [Adonisia turfae]NEZ65556.1 hypothetical protein [Adonisia turfae CCMR0082]